MPTNQNEDVVKVAEAEMSNGALNGKIKIWSAQTGKQVYEATMENGLANGTAVQNGANGKTFQHEIYENGILVKNIYFNPSTGEEIGTITRDKYERAINGKLVTYHFPKNKNGILIDEPKILEIAEYQDSSASGKVIQYDAETGKNFE